uniref:non-specific serine/threonine protein kinase n=1 Tax=Daucus carota subsp. sativus TaxID=79200 RepID=A0A166J2G8_DAUCS
MAMAVFIWVGSKRRKDQFLVMPLFVLVLVFSCFALASSNSDQGATLLEIKKSFRDVDNILYDWRDSPSSDYCGWRGVTCDNVTLNVVALNLSSLNLDGEISTAIGDLTSLISIDMRGNLISGQIPDEIGDCVALQNLDLSFNELYGDIPFSISKLKQLENLVLKNNNLIGPIPSTLSQIPNLKILDLAQNKLSGEIPRLIYWNEVLQYLGLRGNNLVGSLSPDICQLTSLWYFDVRNNSLTGTIPLSIGNCTAFQVLDLSYNKLTGEIPFNIGFLQVATLSLQGNQLTGNIPSVIGLMQALAVLDLSCNMLSGPIPSILGNLTFTEKLELNDNQLSGHIPPALGQLTDLFDLNVANNHLEGPIPDNLSSCTNLNSFNVFGNKLNGTIPSAFERLESMTYLNLSSNNLKGPIPIELSRIGNLDTLDLSHNNLSGPIPKELSQLQNIFSLKLENNNLTGDVMSLVNCLSLTNLNVSYNNLAGDISQGKNFSGFSPDSFLGNPQICGYWLSSPCHASRPPGRVTISKAAILGIALGALVVLLMILVAACMPHYPAPSLDGSLIKPVKYSAPKLVVLHMNMALHKYEDIMRMTESLSEKYMIGYGASSTVYKCVLKNCRPVAVKKLYTHYPQYLKEFETELETVGSIKHRNLVSLQGYSLSPLGNLLFYDYMENGSLWDILSKTADNTVMETVDPEISNTCSDLGDVKKVFQLALLCSKKQPSDRPTMHEVVRVLNSLLPSTSPKKGSTPALAPAPSAKVPCYMDEYANLKTPHLVNCSSMSTSDAQLFLKFGEVISHNSG